MSLALSGGSLLSPVNDGLVGDAILVVEDFEDLRKGLDDPRLGVAVYLRSVDERDLSLGGGAEGLHEGSVGLNNAICRLDSSTASRCDCRSVSREDLP